MAEGDPPYPAAANVTGTACQIQRMIWEVTTEEFRGQDARYGMDSYYGRELLFLAANNEWIRSTREAIEITRSDSVDTQVTIEVDLNMITHEAFRDRTGPIWLPLLILSGPTREPPGGGASSSPHSGPLSEWRRRLRPRFAAVASNATEADPFASLSVANAEGHLLAPLPAADVWHRLSAALAEIFINIAVASWSGPDEERPTSTRDQRLLLAAAIYRFLRDRIEPSASVDAHTGNGRRYPLTERANGPVAGALSGRIGTAKERLSRLLTYYIDEYEDRRRRQPPGQPTVLAAGDPSAGMLIQNAIEVLEALAGATAVVVTADSATTPAVFTVTAPTRRLHASNPPIIGWPRAQLKIDLLLPAADADRQVQVNLPDGVCFDDSQAGTPRGTVTIAVRRPQPIRHLCWLMTVLSGRAESSPRPWTLRRCLADLAIAKADAAIEVLRYLLVISTGDLAEDQDRTKATRDRLDCLRSDLRKLSEGESGSLIAIRRVWGTGDWIPAVLYRPAAIDSLSPRAAITRVTAIEDISHRPTPIGATIDVNVTVADAGFFSVARFAGLMSMLLTAVVLAFFAVLAMHKDANGFEPPSAEVLAATLTLFSVILAGRVRHPDTSTLRGLLSTTGNWLIVFSVMPTVIFAIALAFHISDLASVVWAGGTIVMQMALELLMLRGPLSDTGHPRQPPRRKLSTQPSPDYPQSEALHTNWWRSTTAEALMIGTQAHAYVVWENAQPPALADVLARADAANGQMSDSEWPAVGAQPGPRLHACTYETAHRPANVLALLRSGTARQALTFVVFREQPVAEWAQSLNAHPVPLDPDRLAPLEASANKIDVLVGLPPEDPAPLLADHPVTRVLSVAAGHHLMALDARHPIPAPSAAKVDWRWSRVRIGLRDADMACLPSFLDSICRLTTANPTWDVQIQMTPSSRPQMVIPARRNRQAGAARLIFDSDLDAVTKADGSTHIHRSSAWRLMAICADARVGIEHDVLHRLATSDPRLRLAGVNSAVMHGMAVILLLGYKAGADPANCHDAKTAATTLAELGQAGTNLTVPVDTWQTCTQLGHASRYPLLRVRIRNQDRPGTMRNLLESLGTQIRHGLPSVRGPINTWYALSEISAGYAAFTRISAPLPIVYGRDADWSQTKIGEFKRILEKVEKEVRRSARQAAATSAPPHPYLDGSDVADEPVVSIDFIEAPA